MGRPRKPEGEKYRTPMMALRVPADLQAEIREVAAERGETVTALILRAVRSEIRRHRRHTRKESTATPPDTPNRE